MRVLHLVKTSVGATWAVRQMRELVRLGVEVHVALPPGGPRVPEYEAAGVVVHSRQLDFPIRKPWRSRRVLGALRRLVDTVEPDLIHSHFVGTTLTMRLALGPRHPVPRLFQVPGPLHLEHPFFRWAELRSAGPSDAWIGSCQWTCRRYRDSGICADRVFLSYYGNDLGHMNGASTGKLRRELGIDAGTKLVGMVSYMYSPKRYLGQTRGLKGHEDFIDALAVCLKTEPNLLGVLIGGAWNHANGYEGRVHRYARRRLGDRVRLLGTRNDVSELYPDLDVVVHPSHSENVGGAAESLILAVPTIATDVGGFPDVIKPGETGWLVPPRNPARLAAAILEAVGDPPRARALAAQGQALARTLLDIKGNAKEIFEIYQTILFGPSKLGPTPSRP